MRQARYQLKSSCAISWTEFPCLRQDLEEEYVSPKRQLAFNGLHGVISTLQLSDGCLVGRDGAMWHCRQENAASVFRVGLVTEWRLMY
jgi:hypothetical protein